MPGPTSQFVIYPATTREEGYSNRQHQAKLLAERGISTILLENPFRGRRRPETQRTATLEYVSDFFLLCACAIEEIRSLIAWLYKNAITDIAVAGVSKGGYIAVVAGAVSQLPVSVAALVAPINGIAVFIDGLTGKLCDWRTLQATAPAYGSAEKRMREIFEATSIERIAHPNHKKMIVIGARKDKFVPLMYHQLLGRHWEETEVRWLHGGHVSSILERMHFLSAITSCFDPETCQSV